jgi:Flp pilus assembly protein TadG
MMPAGRDKALARPGTAEDAGSVLVEFAILVTLLLMLAIGAIDYGSMMNQQAMLEAATRAGAEYARANNSSDAPAWTNTQNRVTGFYPAGYSPGLKAFSCGTTGDSCIKTVCSCSDNTTVTCPSAGQANPCAAKTDPTLVEYVSVTAVQTFSPVIPWGSLFFPASLSASTLTRFQ